MMNNTASVRGRRWEVCFAFAFGILTHAIFAISVVAMVVGLHSGLRTGLGPFRGWGAFVDDALLLAQLPVLHSYFLSKRGRALLAKIIPGGLGPQLTTTTFALLASLQLIAAFGLWSPSGVTIYETTGWIYALSLALYAASWLVLIRALTDAGLGLQTGFTGWNSVVRGKRPDYGEFPTQGLFRICRHPVYLGFALVMWTPPVMTLDGLILASIWTLYCLIGPRMKEARYRNWYGERYTQYCASVPYMLPRLGRAYLARIK